MSPTSRPPGFTYSNRQLHADKVAVQDLAKKFGTPLYVYSATAIDQRYSQFHQAFGRVPHTVCYSVKANSSLSILRVLARLGAGFDVVSGGELERVLVANRPAAKKVVFSGVGKTAAEIDLALRAGILIFNAESDSELDLIAERCVKLRKKARIALRVNPDVPAETHPYISTGLREHKFGVPIAQARKLYAQAREARLLDIAGISVHIGSQITAIEPFAAAMQRVAQFAQQLARDGHDIRYIDAGGGLGIDYQSKPDNEPFNVRVRAYAEAVINALRPLKVHLLLEPGRSIVAPAGILVTRVLYLKQNGNKRFAIVDAAMNDLIRPSLYSAYHEIVPVQESGGDMHTYDVVGPVCETGDFFALDRRMSSLYESQLLAILDTGAYGMSLSSNYNTRPRPAEVMVDGKTAKVIRRREVVRDLMRLEC
jgi:diaminopimelate decarboxylase